VKKITSRLSKRMALLCSLGLLLLIGWLDYVTSVEMSLATFYWLPVAIATLFHGGRAGYLLAAGSVAFEIGTDIAGGVAHSHPFFLVWDICTRFLSLASLCGCWPGSKLFTRLANGRRGCRPS
jgi:hypothetical protein